MKLLITNSPILNKQKLHDDVPFNL